MHWAKLIFYFCATLQAVLASPPPENSRVLVVYDDTNTEVSAEAVANPLSQRGYDVTVVSLKDHPKLEEFGIRKVDNVVIIPGKTKALGSTLRAPVLLDFLKLGGNIVALSTPKYNPSAIRELSAQLGITVSGRGIESRNEFNDDAIFVHPSIIASETSAPSSDLFRGGSVAKLSDSNQFTLGLIQAPYTAYSYNAAKDDDEGDVESRRPLTEAFALGNDMFASAALQARNGARFVWVGLPSLLSTPEYAEQLTSWAFQERGNLRIANVSHNSLLSGETHLHYKVEEPLRFCAQVEEWSSQAKQWVPYKNVEDVQLEFTMLDPHYRLNLDSNGCAEFLAPDQYGMFTFLIDYKRPGFTFLDEKRVVTIRHRANDEWDRSWTITNSWVYLSGVSTTVMGFIIFVAIYLMAPMTTTKGDSTNATTAAATARATTSSEKSKPTTKVVSTKSGAKGSSTSAASTKKSARKAT